jgi:hypothetical protein
MRTDGQRERRIDMTKLIVAFRNFANAPKFGRGKKMKKLDKRKEETNK